MSNSIQQLVLAGVALTLAGCDYSAPDYGACDPDRPSNQVSLAQLDGTLQGMDAPTADVVAAIEGEHQAYAYVSSGESDSPPDDAIALQLGFQLNDDATLIPASEDCEIDRLELTATTWVFAPEGAMAEGTWSFSLSRDTAQETFGGFAPQQAALVLDALGQPAEDPSQLDMGFGARFVSTEDSAQAVFSGTGMVSTLGGPSTPSTGLAVFGWGD